MTLVFAGACDFGQKSAPGKINKPLSGPPSGESIYVDQGHPDASDEGPATQDRPLKTLEAAVERADVRSAEALPSTILLGPGVYRERIALIGLPGDGAGPVTFLGSADGQTVISGSDVWSSWEPSGEPGIYSHSWPHKWGLAPLPEGWEESYAADALRKSPLIRRREMIFIDGVRLAQVDSLNSLRRTESAFFVSQEEETVYMRPPARVSLEGSLVEVAIRSNLLGVRERDGVTLMNLTFRHAGTPLQGAAVNFTGSSSVTVVNSRFEWNNWTGLNFTDCRGVVIREVSADNNGSGGITAYAVTDLLMEDNSTSFNNWRGSIGWDTTKASLPLDANFIDFATGQKFFRLRHAVIRRHRSIGNLTGGLWLDYDNSDVLLEGLLMKGNLTHGVFVEASQGPVVIRDSQICENETGLLIATSTDGVAERNYLGRNSISQIFLAGVGEGTRTVANRETKETLQLRSERWRFFDNLIDVQPGQLAMSTLAQPANWQIYLSSLQSDRNSLTAASTDGVFEVPKKRRLSLTEWQRETGRDLLSVSSSASPGCSA